MTMETAMETMTEAKAESITPTPTTTDATIETESHGLHGSTDQLTPDTTAEADQFQPQRTKKAPWVRYRAEYRHRVTDELLRQEDTETHRFEQKASEEIHEPVFELITTFKVRVAETVTAKGDQIAAPAMAPPSYHINIYSLALINAIQSVVKYYPSQDLTGDFLAIKSPYPVLVHHYDELAQFGEECASQKSSELCVRERGAKEHIDLLLAFLDEHIMPDVRREQERNKNGFITFAYYWVSHKPGTTIISPRRGEADFTTEVVHSLTGGTFTNPPEDWNILAWSLAYDGRYLGRVTSESRRSKYDGENPIDREILVVSEEDIEQAENGNANELITEQLKFGKKYWDLLIKQCQLYRGPSSEFPFNEVDSLVMSDVKSHFTMEPWVKPNLMDLSDLRNWSTNCSCSVCAKRKDVDYTQISSMFEDYNSICREDADEWELSMHQYLLCPQHIKAFIFGSRRWERLHVRNFKEPSFDQSMINNLVMNESRKNLLKALSKSFARRNKNGETVPGGMWSADFVKGKGSGLIFLLHGKPGVGKTCTAECIAAFTRRPLMILTPSDIGTTVADVEANLNRNFKTARSWGAVLLIDEADVFMEQRTTADLVRNGLVAAFLRELENYDGILFLTTNRVGAFDDAFISRVHVQLYYPEFTDEQRQKVWKTFIDKLAREKSDTMRLNIDAKEYIRGAEMRAVKWNGREIRNAFQTAVALAEYDAETDEEGKTIVNDTHFRSVVELSRDFKDYLKELHRGDESIRAQRKSERLDTFSSPHKAN
ncbi:hypothetical protein EDB81DRAFT_803177 [Dactylonectria macrodidyma]|uniref:AAA+ ATPase domain-containing protein n=1 Tax=Dactylonectria macrodidyma TaxID=307937 RepID=A0A9P9EBG1_9HYPO|nr:hypothetical protein EDB81DRAFT_803177 [Dactylonectria macrodidyma]